MVSVAPGRGRARIDHSGSNLVITIPSKKNYLLLTFLAVWLCAWLFGVVSALTSLDLSFEQAGAQVFTLVWLLLWCIGGAFAIAALLWGMAGKEVVTIGRQTLCHDKRLPIYTWRREYDITHIRSLSASGGATASVFDPSRSLEFWGLTGGSIRFDYGRSTHRFGVGLDDADAKHVVAQIEQHNAALTQ